MFRRRFLLLNCVSNTKDWSLLFVIFFVSGHLIFDFLVLILWKLLFLNHNEHTRFCLFLSYAPVFQLPRCSNISSYTSHCIYSIVTIKQPNWRIKENRTKRKVVDNISLFLLPLNLVWKQMSYFTEYLLCKGKIVLKSCLFFSFPFLLLIKLNSGSLYERNVSNPF